MEAHRRARHRQRLRRRRGGRALRAAAARRYRRGLARGGARTRRRIPPRRLPRSLRAGRVDGACRTAFRESAGRPGPECRGPDDRRTAERPRPRALRRASRRRGHRDRRQRSWRRLAHQRRHRGTPGGRRVPAGGLADGAAGRIAGAADRARRLVSPGREDAGRRSVHADAREVAGAGGRHRQARGRGRRARRAARAAGGGHAGCSAAGARAIDGGQRRRSPAGAVQSLRQLRHRLQLRREEHVADELPVACAPARRPAVHGRHGGRGGAGRRRLAGERAPDARPPRSRPAGCAAPVSRATRRAGRRHVRLAADPAPVAVDAGRASRAGPSGPVPGRPAGARDIVQRRRHRRHPRPGDAPLRHRWTRRRSGRRRGRIGHRRDPRRPA